jgi:hypothetical protein
MWNFRERRYSEVRRIPWSGSSRRRGGLHSPAPFGQGHRRGDAHIVGYYVLVYAATREHTGRAVGRGLRASGRGRAKAALPRQRR